jgi:hypothetical protein
MSQGKAEIERGSWEGGQERQDGNRDRTKERQTEGRREFGGQYQHESWTSLGGKGFRKGSGDDSFRGVFMQSGDPSNIEAKERVRRVQIKEELVLPFLCVCPFSG